MGYVCRLQAKTKAEGNTVIIYLSLLITKSFFLALEYNTSAVHTNNFKVFAVYPSVSILGYFTSTALFASYFAYADCLYKI